MLIFSAIVLGVIILIPVFTIWGIYNTFIAKRNKVQESFSGIHVQLKRRADLIPNLVRTVRAYTKHEREVLEELTNLRTEFLDLKPDDYGEIIKKDNMIIQALKSLFAVVENYPNLKASQNFLKLQESLEETEDQIAAARRIYNSNVNSYNVAVQQFPGRLVAKWFKFKIEPFYEIDKDIDKSINYNKVP